MMKTLHLKVGNLDSMSKNFIDVWNEAKAGKKIKPKRSIVFDNWQSMLKAISGNRYELLKALHKLGECSILALSKHIKRDYRIVYHDIKVLEQCGLIDNKNGKISTQWSNIIIELPLVNSNVKVNNTKFRNKKIS